MKARVPVVEIMSATPVTISADASVAEAAGLSPVIIVIPGHAFAGIILPQSKQVLLVETTGCGGGTLATSMSFAQAQASAAAPAPGGGQSAAARPLPCT